MAQTKKREPEAPRGAPGTTGGTASGTPSGGAAPTPRSAPGGDARTRAEVEFAKYRSRMAGGEGGGRTLRFGLGSPGGPAGAIPRMGGPARPGGADASAESVTEGLGTAVRLGMDIMNAGLAGGLRILGSLADMSYGMRGAAGRGGEDCGCGCGGGSHSHGHSHDACCGHDCCSIMGADPCCRPSVGSCC